MHRIRCMDQGDETTCIPSQAHNIPCATINTLPGYHCKANATLNTRLNTRTYINNTLHLALLLYNLVYIHINHDW